MAMYSFWMVQVVKGLNRDKQEPALNQAHPMALLAFLSVVWRDLFPSPDVWMENISKTAFITGCRIGQYKGMFHHLTP